MLYKAMTTRDELTENGMATNSTSSNPVLDLFFKMGGWNSTTTLEEVIDVFTNAYYYDRVLATKCLFYNRDVRGGQGRRETFRVMFKWLCENDPNVALENLSNVVEFGRWDDVFFGLQSPITTYITDFILAHLKMGDKLCAKWMPRENKSKGNIAKFLMSQFNLSPKEYRQLLSGNTEVVENLMCQREWKAINYNHVPSVAINKYRTAFYRNDGDRFAAWIESLSKPESGNKIHADAIYPHDIVKRISSDGSANALLEAQWKALPNFMPEGRRILPVCDVSGSMLGEPLEVCISLGLYLSERNTGPFKDGFITFSAKPELQLLHGSLAQRINQLETAHWDMNTNLEAVFRLILSKAIQSNITQADMPSEILILSDMQFDKCVTGMSAMDMIRVLYAQAGYKVPNIIFWNLRTSSGVPVKFDEDGTALVSGFSPSIMKSLLGGNITPMRMMLSVLNSERYSVIR
jgi:hypothetical protein